MLDGYSKGKDLELKAQVDHEERIKLCKRCHHPTCPGEEKVLKSVIWQFFCVNNAFSLGDIGLFPKCHSLEFPVARIEYFRMIDTIDDSTSRGITNFKIFLYGLEGPYECGICQIPGCT